MLLNEQDMLSQLRLFSTSCKDQKTAAKLLEISESYLCDCLKGRKIISDQLARKLGYERHYYYEKKEVVND